MTPVTALPVQPLTLPGQPPAAVMLDFTVLLQGGPAATPLPESVEDAPLPATVTLADTGMPEPSAEQLPAAEQAAAPLPAPPPILTLFQTPASPVVAAVRAAPAAKGMATPVTEAPRPPETLDLAAPAIVAQPGVARPQAVAVADAVPLKPEKAAPPVVQQIAPHAVAMSSPTPPPAVAATPQSKPVQPNGRPVIAASAPTSLPLEAPRSARSASPQPGLPVSEVARDASPPAPPVVREAPAAPPPVEIQAMAADAPVIDQQAVPQALAQPAATPAAPAPVQHGEAPQPPIDTNDPRWIDQMAQQIADLADGDGRARFRLNPETLGSMEVSVRHTADGISVKFEVESESARTLIAHAEQRLQTEARANGVRIADTQVDLADRGPRDGRDRPTEQPLIAIRTGGDSAEPTPSAEGASASARYA